ncbi:MAG: LysM peptidoglycan-binding domain-containing protein [Verrucomicrobiota bacterium]|jgi:hypothetical protein|nr:LysM peptidoglycan-binding domain-containing protein [Verrucomicrobiota bacterium]
MSFQRGTYGVEYDEQQSSPFRRLWVPAALVLAVALPLLFLRGCGGAGRRTAATDEEPGQTRYPVPEVETKRESPSFWRHFLNFGGRDGEETETAAKAAAGSGQTARWLGSEGAARPAGEAKIQSPEVRRLLEQVAQLETADDLVGARRILHQILSRKDADDVRAFCERRIGELNTALVFGDRAMPEKIRHTIAPGDLIGKLVKRYGNTQEYLFKANGIDDPNRLRVGREIWALENPAFEVAVSKASGAVVTLNGQFFKRYETGLGGPPDVPAGVYTVRGGILARLGLRNADAEELRILLPGGVAVAVVE